MVTARLRQGAAVLLDTIGASMTGFDLTPLWNAVQRAKAAKSAPPPAGEVKAVLPVGSYLDEDDWLLLLVAASHLEDHHRAVFNLFLTEDFIATLLVRFLGESDSVPAWEESVEYLSREAAQDGEWLIAVPVANLQPTATSATLSEDAMLVRTKNQRDWQIEDREPSRQEVYAHMKDDISLRPRWLPHAGDRLDTRNGAALLVVERATQELALAVARSRAQYALATWCVLKPPTRDEVWPSVGAWAPQPWLRLEGNVKPYEPGMWTGRTNPRLALYIYGEYPGPADEPILRAPFDAMTLAAERRCARALLSASRSLYISNRRPTDLEVTERLIALVTAVMSLCEPAGQPVSDAGVFKRWMTVSAKLRVWERTDEIRLTEERVRALHARLRDVRNIAAHGSDAVLVNLGYPSNAVRPMLRNRRVSGSDLALAVIVSAWEPLAYAVPHVVRSLWQEALEHGFDDERFERNFVD